MPATRTSDAVTWPVGVVAARLETTTSTLRAWERRYGLGPSARTRGGHRRYTAVDVQLLRRMRELLEQGVSAADAARALRPDASAGTTKKRPIRDGNDQLPALIAGMYALDVRTVNAVLSHALTELGVVAAWTDLIAPALVGIGEHWERTGCGVEIEHISSGIIEDALRRHSLHAQPRPEPNGQILLTCAPGERHSLPPVALAAALAERDVPATFASDLPPRALADAIARLRPRAIVLWARRAEAASADYVRHARAMTQASVYLAGPGWSARTIPPEESEVLCDLVDAVQCLCPHSTHGGA